MTIPLEEKTALEYAEKFLMEIHRGDLKKIDPEVREMVRRILRHYPGPTRIQHLFESETTLAELREKIRGLEIKLQKSKGGVRHRRR